MTMNANELSHLSDSQIRTIYARAAQRHSEDRFLVGMATAVCHSDAREWRLIRPAALVIIDERGLTLERRAVA